MSKIFNRIFYRIPTWHKSMVLDDKDELIIVYIF